jgi:hypothetical protein
MMGDLQDIERSFTTFDLRSDGRVQAARVIEYQRSRIPFYDRYCRRIEDLGMTYPYLPVAAFKDRRLATESSDQAVFYSSGTGSERRSRHHVHRLGVYNASVATHFEHVVGSGPFALVAHLPGYQAEGDRSSLIHMVRTLIQRFGSSASGFSLDDPELIRRASAYSRKSGERLIVIGAAFGLLDLAETGGTRLPGDALVIETGGMKTRRRETDRATLHASLATGLGVREENVWSEYGMCELLSQLYTRGGAEFYPPPWVHTEVVDLDDPTQPARPGQEGLLALFDLANMYSISAVLTQDRAVAQGDGVEIRGRASGAELRGCNFLVSD